MDKMSIKKQIAAIKETRAKIVVVEKIINEKRRKLYQRHGKPLRALKSKLAVLENELFSLDK